MYRHPNYLCHYGVLGMKWGRRRVRNKISGLNKKRISKYSSDYNETRTLRRKSSKKLSNEELKKLNKRMNLEQEYNRLSTSNVNRGMQIAKNVVATAGTIGGLYAISKSDYAKAGRNLIKNLY